MTKVEKRMIIDAPIDLIWNIVTNNNDYHWRTGIKKIEIIDQYNFIEYTNNNVETYFTITKKEKYKKYHFQLKNNNMTGNWIGTFKELDNNKTELIFTEEIKVNSFLMKLLVKPYLKKQQNNYEKDLLNKIKMIS